MTEQEIIDQIKEDNLLSSSINLRENEKFQLLLASQNYGTFYCIYGRFHLNNDLLEKIELVIVNYKGASNIGFVEHTGSNLIKLHKGTDNDGDDHLIIEIPVMGFCNDRYTEADETNFVNGTEINISGIKNVSVFRGLIRNRNILGSIHDSEYCYRDGLSHEERYSDREKLPKGMYFSLDDWTAQEPQDFSVKASGYNCFTSNLDVNP